MPILLLVGVSLYNWSQGEANPVLSTTDGGSTLFQLVTPRQFAAAIIGFLTYRLPLFAIQMESAFQGDSINDNDSSQQDGVVLPGSAGMALQLTNAMQQQQQQQSSKGEGTTTSTRTTVFLISGPQATGRSELVQRFLQEQHKHGKNYRFVTPTLMDRRENGAVYERCEQRGEFLYTDEFNRFGLTKQAILDAAATGGRQQQRPGRGLDDDTNDNKSSNHNNHHNNNNVVVVIDANIELVKQLSQVSGLRLVGVWIGLNSVSEYEKRLNNMIDNGTIPILEGETREITIRNKIRDIVKEIEYGISCGIFEFTILNDDNDDNNHLETSLKQLREASNYI